MYIEDHRLDAYGDTLLLAVDKEDYRYARFGDEKPDPVSAAEIKMMDCLYRAAEECGYPIPGIRSIEICDASDDDLFLEEYPFDTL